jgi:hypothetical protein
MYQVRIGAQTMSARSTISLFVGQRFRAVWDASTSPPMLRLQQSDMAVLARFAGRDQGVAMALLSRGMQVDDDTVLELRRQWAKSGGDPARLSALAELMARGADMTEHNASILVWYMGLVPEEAARIWKKIRERLRNRKFSSPKELLEALRDDGDEEEKRFLGAHALAGRPARAGIDPAQLFAHTWWPVNKDLGKPLMARVAFSREKLDDRQVWRSRFEFEGHSLGFVEGDVMTNGRALSASIRLDGEKHAECVRDALPKLKEELEGLPLSLQYIGVGVCAHSGAKSEPDKQYGLDMEI